MSNVDDDNSHATGGVEPDQLPIGKLFGWLAAVSAAVVLLLLLVWTYYKSATSSLVTDRQSARRDPVLEEAKATDKALLGSYTELDRAKGVYRIPIDQAMELLLANPALLEPIAAPASPATAPTTAPATAPTTAPTTAPAAAR